MKLSQSYGRKENPQVDWKTVVIENRQMVRMGQQGAVVSEFELLWESAMLFGKADIMRAYYSEQKKQLDIRSQLLSLRKKIVDSPVVEAVPQKEEVKPTYTEENFSIPEGVELDPLLLDYAKEGFEYGIQKVIEISNGKVNLECTSQSGYTPLQEAAFRGHIPCLKVLLSAGANIEAKSVPREYTPLVLAAMANKEEAFDYLLSCGADLHTSPRGGTILHCANFHLSMIKKLIHLGLSIDHVDTSGKTALFKCAENNNVEGCLILLEYGANIFTGAEPHTAGGQYTPVYPIVVRTSDIKHKLALLMKYVVIQSWSKSKFMFMQDTCFKALPRDIKLLISSMLFDYSKIDEELLTKTSYRIDVLK